MAAKKKPAPAPDHAPVTEDDTGVLHAAAEADTSEAEGAEEVAPSDPTVRAPFAERLAELSETEVEALIHSPLLGERKLAQARARLAELRAKA